MLKSIISVFMTIVTFFSSLAAADINVSAPAETSDFVPVLRFMVASDTHVATAGDRQCKRIQKALKMSYAIAEADGNYKKLDGVIFAGDTTDDGLQSSFCAFKAAVDSVIKPETQVMPLLAQAHDGGTYDYKSLDYFKLLHGVDATDNHYVINGYHFITMSRAYVDGVRYADYQREWLKAELDKAVADDPTKPVFFAQHEHVDNTVYGSSDFEGWDDEFFKDIFMQYPQLVHFSGHSHYPLNDPRSLWQGEFTAIGTGSLYYVELTVEDVRTMHPDGYRDEVQYWVVEVDADSRVRLIGIDLVEEKILVEYILDNPADPANRDYTPEKQEARSTAPVFAKDAKVEAKTSFGITSLTFDSAKSADGAPVYLYRINVVDEDGTEVYNDWLLPKYYSATVDATNTVKLGVIGKGDYTATITAETVYGVKSVAITHTFTK
ncbi:MAG: metallophosphoesterase [Clostridia bacterium]|nr:metallophosphoesterase [Clostridia bacterium]